MGLYDVEPRTSVSSFDLFINILFGGTIIEVICTTCNKKSSKICSRYMKFLYPFPFVVF
jgi:hypothetical protein